MPSVFTSVLIGAHSLIWPPKFPDFSQVSGWIHEGTDIERGHEALGSFDVNDAGELEIDESSQQIFFSDERSGHNETVILCQRLRGRVHTYIPPPIAYLTVIPMDTAICLIAVILRSLPERMNCDGIHFLCHLAVV